MRIDNNMPKDVIQAILKCGLYEKATPKKNKIEQYVDAIVILQSWADEGWCTFKADDLSVMQKNHYVTVKWKSKTQDEMMQGKEFAKLVALFDDVTPDGGDGEMYLGISLYNPVDQVFTFPFKVKI